MKNILLVTYNVFDKHISLLIMKKIEETDKIVSSGKAREKEEHLR